MPDFDYPTTSPTAGLGAGLARGIFGYRQKQKEEETKRTDAERDRSLKFLSSLLDQVEPESQPMLLKQIGDVMGLKGKDRSLWDRLTGRGMEGDREAIQQRTSGVLGQLVGPAQAKELRGGPAPRLQEQRLQGQPVPGVDNLYLGGLMVPNMAVGADRPNRLPSNALVLRDPRAEKLADIKAQHGARTGQQEALLQERYRLMGERDVDLQKGRVTLQEDKQKQEKDILYLRAEVKAEEKINALARQLAATDPNGYHPYNQIQHKVKAAEMLLADRSLTDEGRRALITLRNAQAQQAAQIAASGGLTPGQQATDRRAIYDDAFKLHREWQMGRDSAVNAGKVYRDKNTKLVQLAKAQGGTYDTQTGTFSPPEIGLRIDILNPGLVTEEQKAKKLEEESLTRMRTSWQQLNTPYFRDYVVPGADEWDIQLKSDREISSPEAPVQPTLKAPPAGVPQKGAPPPIQVPVTGVRPPKGMPSRIVAPEITGGIMIGSHTQALSMGQQVLNPDDGKVYRVVRVLPADAKGIVRYHFQLVR